MARTPISRFLYLLFLLARSIPVCYGAVPDEKNGSSITTLTLRAAVLTHAAPFAVLDEYTGVYSGFQIDLLEHLKLFALKDGVKLNVILEEAPLYAYVLMLDRLSDNCNTTENPQPLEECGRYDLLIGDYYTNEDRSMRVDFTPPFLRTAVSAVKFIYSDISRVKDVTTMEEATTHNATICVVDGSYMDDIAMERFPHANYYKCSDPEDCIQQIKSSRCPLFVDDELQLRYRTTLDPTLQVTQENFNSQFVVWPMRYSLEESTRKYLKRWMYAAKSNATLDELDDRYFSVNLCPVGKAGPHCDQPCHPVHGRSDRLGQCLCDSTKWTGDDCATEVMEDTNGIPHGLVMIGYIMVGINFTGAFLCFVWLFLYRQSPQVQVAQPFFLCLVLVGCIISTFTIVPLAQENLTTSDSHSNDVWCMSIPWFYSVGFSITFGTLFAKIRRVYVLFKNAVSDRAKKISISWKETLSIVGGVLLVDIVVLAAWTILDPLHWERTTLAMDKYGAPLSSEGYCTGDHWDIFAGIIAILHFGLLGFACYLCYVARDIPTKFSEGRYLAIAMISNLQIFVVGVPVLVILGNDPQSSFFVRSVIIWMNDLVVLGLVFGNLMLSLWRDRKNKVDSKVAIRTAFQQYSSKHHRRSSIGNSSLGNSSSRTMQPPPLTPMATPPPASRTKLPNISENDGGAGDVAPPRRKSERSGPRSSGSRRASKRECAPDTWGGLQPKVALSCRDESSVDGNDEDQPRIVARSQSSHKERIQRERLPDSWVAIKMGDESENEYGHDRSARSVERSSRTMDKIAEEGESKAFSCNTRKAQLKDASLPENAGVRFEYANNRIQGVRMSRSSVSELEDPFEDEPAM